MKPKHDSAMWCRSVDFLARTPRVRQIRPNQHQVSIAIGCNMVADITLAAAIQRKSEFVFGMIMPFKGKRFQTSVKHGPRAAIVNSHLFKKWLHRPAALLSKVSLFAVLDGKARACCFPGE